MKRILLTILVLFLGLSLGWAQVHKPYLSVEEMADSYALLPAPPQPGSQAFRLDKEYYKLGKQLRNTPRGAQAVKDADVSEDNVLSLFTEAFGQAITPETMPELTELLLRAKETFGDYATRVAKTTHNRMRPFVYYNEPSAIPSDDEGLKNNGSYPSGHTAIFTGLGLIMSEINPERHTEIMQRSYDGGFSRVIAGAHWFSDVEAGRLIAAVAFARLHADPEFCAQLERAKKEFAEVCGNQSDNTSQLPMSEKDLVSADEMLSLLLKYIHIESGSKETDDGSYPMTPGQMEMARLLKKDAEALGLKAILSEWGYVYIDIPSNAGESVPVLGVSCHLDFTPEAPGIGIHPIVTKYTGGDLLLPDGSVISPSNPDGAELPALVGKTIIHTDGKTLLGGDDKNGCAIVMSLLKTLVNPACKHGRIQVAFCPNEDIGMAAEKIDTTLFNPDILFDIDGMGGRDIAASNFTARGMKVKFIGHEAHASEAKKQKLGDALAASAAYISSVPVKYRPENSEGMEGYIHHWGLSNEGFDYTVSSRIRYFDSNEGALFDNIIQQSLEKVRADYPNVRVEVIWDEIQYDNVANTMFPASRQIVERAADRCNLAVDFISERGGTTAAMFTAKGLKGGMCIFSGQHNCHKVHEYSCLEEMMDSYYLMLCIVDEVSKL